MLDFNFEKYCYGCSACLNICPKGAITMKKNCEGFLIPNIDKSKCVNCKLCKIVCPYLNEKKENALQDNDYVLAAYRKNSNFYKNYTSSGIVNAVAVRFSKNDNFVCGCIWDNNMQAKHVISNELDTIKKMSYSKYVQSDMNTIYIEIKNKINEGKKVLFCGTPCQVAAVKKYIKNNVENLYTIAIVCHGTPSPEVWKTYKEELEKENNSKMTDANFRYKGKYGWISPFTKYYFENGKSIEKLSFTDDPYVIAFGEDMLHRKSCYRCHYKGSNSEADLVVGDFWGCSNKLLKASKNRGICSIIVHTEKGKNILEMISDEFIYEKISFQQMLAENKPVLYPVKYNINRDKFFERFKQNKNLDYIKIPMNSKKYKIKSFLYKFYIFEFLKRILYKIKH